MSAKSLSAGRVRTCNRPSSKKKNTNMALAAAIGAMGIQLIPLLGVGGQRADAATYTWDPGGGVSNPTGGTGTWNVTHTNIDWSTGSADTYWSDQSANGTDTAIFGGTAGTVTLGANLSAAGVIFLTNGYKIAAADTLTLGSGGVNAGSLTTGSVTLAPTIALATTEVWTVGSGANVNDTGNITGAGNGITLLGGGTLKVSGSDTYTGTTTVDNGTFILNFAAGGASNILSTSSSLAVGGGGTLEMSTTTATVSSTQTFAGTTLTTGASSIAISNTGTHNPTLALGPMTVSGAGAAGQAVVLTGITGLTSSGILLGQGTMTIGAVDGTALATNAVNGTIVSVGNTAAQNSVSNGVAGADFATVGLYDFAALDPTGTFIEGGSAITGSGGANGTSPFYTPFSGSGNSLSGNADISGTTTTNNNGESPTSIRFNSTSATTLSINTGASGAVHDGGILVTPNLGANNVNINGNAGALTARNNGSLATEMIVYQNNTLGFLNINTGIGNTTATDSYCQVGAGTVVLASAGINAYLGQTYLDGGTTEISADNDIGLASSGTTLTLQGGALVGTASFALDNGGGNARPISILSQGGTLAATTGNTLTVDGAITGTGALTIGAGTITGTGTGTANTTAVTTGGIVILNGASNTYSGGTTVKSTATLQVDGVGSTGTGPVTLNTANATLAGVGSITGNVTVTKGAVIAGDAGIGTLTMAGLALTSNSNLDFEFSPTSSPTNNLIDLTGNSSSLVLPSSGTATLNVLQQGSLTAPYSGPPGLTTYDLFQINGGIANPSAFLTSLQADIAIKGVTSASVATYTLGLSGNDITLTIDSFSTNATWAIAGSGNWSDGPDNWTNGIAPANPGDVANFLSSPGITAPSTVTLDVSETVGAINFNNAFSYSISEPTGGGTTLTLNSGGAGAGVITDSGGTHTLAVPIALTSAASITVVNPTDSLVISGDLSGTTALSINPAPMNGAGTVILADPGGNAGYSGTPTVNSGTLQIGNGGATGGFGTFTGTITVNGTLSYDLTSSVTLTNKIIGAGTLQQSGMGILNVDHADTMAFTNITNGTLQLGVSGALGTSSVNIASPGVLDLNDKSPTLNALSGNGTIDDVSAGGTVSLTIGTSGVSTNNNTFNGSIRNTTGTVSLVQAGTGTLSLYGASTYSGGTSITAGAIKAYNNSAFGTGTITISSSVINALQLANGVNISNPIVPNTGNVINAFEDVPDPGASATLSGTITTTKDFRVGTSQRTSTIVLTGNDSVAGGTAGVIISRGNVVFAGNDTFVDNGTSNPLYVGKYSSTSSVNAVIQDNAVVTCDTGFSLGGSESTQDDASTTLTLTGNGTLNTGPDLTDLNNDMYAVSTATLNLEGTSTLATSGFELLSASGDATSVFFNGGSIVANGNDPAGGFFPNLSSTLINGTSLSVQVQAGGGTINNNGFTITIGQALLDGGQGSTDSMTFTGTGVTIVSGSNTYAGGTTISQGTLRTASASPLGAGPVAVASTAILDLDGNSPTVGNLSGSGTVDNVSAGGNPTLTINTTTSSNFSGNIQNTTGTVALSVGGTGTQTLSGANTYSGGTTISGGTVQTGSASALGTGPVAVNTPGILDLHGNSPTIGNLSGSGTVDNLLFILDPTLTINTSTSSNFSGTIQNTAGSVAVTVSGTGTQELSGTNTYQGATTVSGGTLLAGAANALSPNSSINVTGGTLDVSGSAQTVPSLTVGASGTLNLGIGNVLTDNGTATFGGTLNISGAPTGPSVELMSYPMGDQSGTFSSVTPEAGYNLVYGSTELELVVVASGPANLTWNNAGLDNLWNATSTNWNNGSGNSVYSDGSTVTFDDNNPSSTAANYAVTLNTTVSPGSVTVNNSAGNYSISGTGSIAGTASLTKSGTGLLTLSTPNTYTGGTNVTAGTLLIEPTSPTTSALPTGALSVSGSAIVQLADNVTAGTPYGTSNVVITSLSLIGNGTLDIGNNRILISYTPGNDPITSIEQWIANGFTEGDTPGSGPAIISSDIAADDALSGFSYGIGYADSADPGNPAGLATDTIEIMFTLVGDANLDGVVNAEDFTPFSHNLNQNGVWDQGDFNYDGVVNAEDFTPFSHNLNQSAVLAAAAGTLAPANGGISLTNVPEPASTGLLLAAGLGMLIRRRRRVAR